MQNDTPKMTTQQQTCHIRQYCIKWEIVYLHRSRYQICCQTARLNVCTRSMQTPDSFPQNCLQTASAHLPWTRQRWQAALVQTNLSLEVHRITRCFFTVLKNSTDWEVIASWFWQVYLSEKQPMYTFLWLVSQSTKMWHFGSQNCTQVVSQSTFECLSNWIMHVLSASTGTPSGIVICIEWVMEWFIFNVIWAFYLCHCENKLSFDEMRHNICFIHVQHAQLNVELSNTTIHW